MLSQVVQILDNSYASPAHTIGSSDLKRVAGVTVFTVSVSALVHTRLTLEGRAMAEMLSTLTTSVIQCCRMAVHNNLKLRHDHLGNVYTIESSDYKIFRETEAPAATGEAVVLVIGFRLKLIRSSPVLHWLFQRICILTTPFWSGLKGFKTKLWMVDPKTKNYLGIYDWRGEQEAQYYLNFLIPILNIFSISESVWEKHYYEKDFEHYLAEHAKRHAEVISAASLV